MTNKKLVMIRHGESQWNKLNKFTGWYDSELSELGKKEAKIAALLLKKEKFIFDLAYSSVLQRAIHTLWYILKELNQTWLSVEKSWRLNERHYGALQGLNKTETALKFGNKKVMLWRRSVEVLPPQINITDDRFPGNDIRYSHLKIDEIPLGESLYLTSKRVIPYWENTILPQLKNNKRILIVAHGNSLRALMQYLNNLDDENIMKLNIPTAVPIVLEFDKKWIPLTWHYLK
ncbi:2,3-diphosphoglycerate-dependent phosphoglycerate mutase [Buchnera aphidicola (Muscaphis stroyani)]|uniref:2,3-bisphosphoglycerate-dependent phosphoglycerate mutase n=1 Tax=Buchnera aphidicola (Muscaphis stroyani) TaxID=1241869 RepID=A0A4D6YIU8_9GAMM|nr:2,3-diphosphoglycerate-dependent phosphoglycerate mutase [Buchnera aphidicola]QCI24375.1 2,3-diphosphoglycerate-dependent phosphoglycerate mutase [Buchnera aphidicola (Muscaphis stroyani)]